MKRVLITGMSGTGKSTLVGALRSRGFKAVDTDDGWCEPTPDGRQLWREDAIRDLLATEDRTTNAYGRSPEEFQRFLADVEQVEPLLRRAADHVVDTTVSPAGVVAAVLD